MLGGIVQHEPLHLTRVFGFILFFAIACAVIAGLHYYFWIRLVRDPQLSGPARHIGTAAAVLLACVTIATPVMGRLFPRVGRVLAWPGFLWMGMMFILAVFLFGGDVLRWLTSLAARLSGNPGFFDPSRRLFTARALAGGALTAMIGVTAAAIKATRGQVAVKRVEVFLERLSPSADGMRIAQVCDMHVGGLLGRSFVEQVVEATNQLAPDVIAVVGDLVDGSIERLRPEVAPMAALRARHGVFFVTGNHEYYSSSGAQAWVREIEHMGIRVLANQRVPIGTVDAGFDLAGVPDHGAARFPDQGPPEDVRPRSRTRRGPARAPTHRHLPSRPPRGRPAALRTHPRRPDLALGRDGETATAVHPRPRSSTPHTDLRQLRHRILGPAHAPRRARRDHRDRPAIEGEGLVAAP